MNLRLSSARSPFGLRCLLAASFSTLLLSGCSKNEEPTNIVKLPPGLVALQEEVIKGKNQVDLTIKSLEAVIAAAGPNAKPKYDEFVKSMGELDAQAASIKAKADDMRARGAAYFKAWEEQLAAVTTPSIKEQAEKRRDQLTKNYEAVTVAVEAAREAYRPVLSDLKDVQQMLTTDLTADSVKALGPPVVKIKDNAKVLGGKLDAVVDALKKIGAVYSAQT
jgi:DUF2959 family protein